jgi:hypothetical protein
MQKSFSKWIPASAFVAVLCAQAILLLSFGIAGVGGNGIVTGLYLTLTLSILAISTLRSIRPALPDAFYLMLLVGVLGSFSTNIDAREASLLSLTLSAYPIGRLLSAQDVESIKVSCFWGSGAVALIGGAATAVALLARQDAGHPLVFGFDQAATSFSTALALFVFALISLPRDKIRDNLGLGLISLCTLVFAASLVRFTLIAIMIVLFVAMVVGRQDRHKTCLKVLIVLLVATAAGFSLRPAATSLFVGKIIENATTEPPTGTPPPSETDSEAQCFDNLYAQTSISIRRTLLLDSLSFLPRTGVFGLGLDGYSRGGCIRGFPPHNDLIQSTIEFGWLGGLGFLLLFSWPPISLLLASRRDSNAAFVLSLCLFFVLLSCVYGRISREIPLFLTLGFCGGLAEQLAD